MDLVFALTATRGTTSDAAARAAESLCAPHWRAGMGTHIRQPAAHP